MSDPTSSPPLNALLEAGDPRLLEAVLASREPEALGALAPGWAADARPQVRAALLRYVDSGCETQGHRVLVKRLFKLAEQRGDDELMAHFLVAFDHWIRRTMGKRRHWDGGYWVEPILIPDHGLPPQDYGLPLTPGFSGAIFSRATRQYLCRRAFRYFRLLGFKDPARYRRAVSLALPLYRDEQLRTAVQLLDSWGLVHVLYGRSPVLQRRPRGVILAPGRSLGELQAAPMFPDVWWEGFEELLAIFERAAARPVRTWALELLRHHHAEALRALPAARLRSLLLSKRDDVQAAGLEWLESAPDLDALPISDWLELLRVESAALLPRICELVREHVAPERLDLAQCVALACSKAAPVASLGLDWARAKPSRGADLPLLCRLAAAQAPAVRAEAVGWLVALLRESAEATPEQVRGLVDSRFADVRRKGLELMLGDERFRDLPLLWNALAESPDADVREVLVGHLEERARQFPPQTLRHVWASTLLAVHRGGKAKLRAARQLSERIVGAPGEASSLLPLLAVALRSIRAPERRAALGAVAQAAFREPALRAAIGQAMPELKLFPEEAA